MNDSGNDDLNREDDREEQLPHLDGGGVHNIPSGFRFSEDDEDGELEQPGHGGEQLNDQVIVAQENGGGRLGNQQGNRENVIEEAPQENEPSIMPEQQLEVPQMSDQQKALFGTEIITMLKSGESAENIAEYFEGNTKGQAINSEMLREAYFYMLEAPNSAQEQNGEEQLNPPNPTEEQGNEFKRRYEILKMLCDQAPQRDQIVEMSNKDIISLPNVGQLSKNAIGINNNIDKDKVTNALMAVMLGGGISNRDQEDFAELNDQWKRFGGSHAQLANNYEFGRHDGIERQRLQAEQNVEDALRVDQEQQLLINRYLEVLLYARDAEKIERIAQAEYNALRLIRYRDSYDKLSPDEQKGFDLLVKYYVAESIAIPVTEKINSSLFAMRNYVRKLGENSRSQNYENELSTIKKECFEQLKNRIKTYETKENDINGFGHALRSDKFDVAYGHDWTMRPNKESSYEDKIEYLGRQTWMMSCGIYEKSSKEDIKYGMGLYEKHRQYLEDFYRKNTDRKKLGEADFSALDKISQLNSRTIMHQAALIKKEWMTVHVKDVKGVDGKTPGHVCDEMLKLCRIGDKEWMDILSIGIQQYKPLEPNSKHMSKKYKAKRRFKRMSDGMVKGVNWLAKKGELDWPLKIFIVAIFPPYALMDPKIFGAIMGIPSGMKKSVNAMAKAGRGVLAAGEWVGGFAKKAEGRTFWERLANSSKNAQIAAGKYWKKHYPDDKLKDIFSRDGFVGLQKSGRMTSSGGVLELSNIAAKKAAVAQRSEDERQRQAERNNVREIMPVDAAMALTQQGLIGQRGGEQGQEEVQVQQVNEAPVVQVHPRNLEVEGQPEQRQNIALIPGLQNITSNIQNLNNSPPGDDQNPPSHGQGQRGEHEAQSRNRSNSRG